MREDIYPPGGGSALAGLLSGVPGEASAGGNDHKNVLSMRKGFHIRFIRKALAQILWGLSDEADENGEPPDVKKQHVH